MKLGFIGCGNMAQAMITGILTQKVVSPQELIVSNPREEKTAKLKDEFGIITTTDNKEVAKQSDILVLSVKPQVYPAVIKEIRDEVSSEQIIVTIAAGVSMEAAERQFGKEVKMGVGTPVNILEAVDRGVDFFDCVYPTRNGRHGHVYTNQGKLNMFNKKYELDHRPIEEGCQCPACRSYSRAYIRHLLKAKEMLGMRLCVLHNLYFYNTMMSEIRQAIEEGNYKEYKKRKIDGMMNQ